MPTLSQRRQGLSLRGNQNRASRRHRPPQLSEEEERSEEEAADEEGGDGEEEEDDDYDDDDDDGAGERARDRGRKRKRKSVHHVETAGRRRNKGGNGDNDDGGGDEGDTDSDAPESQAVRQKRYHELLAKKLVRYALSCESRRLPIRRQAVKEQVLDNQGKYFRKVFPLAQGQLRDIFGMELAEWPVRDESTMTVRERRKALKTQKATAAPATTAAAVMGAANDGPSSVAAANAAAASGPATATTTDRYILVSTLSEAYRASVFTPLSSDPMGPKAAVPPAPDSAYLGFATLVVALLTLAGGSLIQSDLEKYLTRLHGSHHGPVRTDANMLGPSVAAAMGDHIEDDEGGGGAAGGAAGAQSDAVVGGTLQHLVRQGYVIRVVEASVPGEGAGGGAAGSKVTWHVGPRGRLEMGPAEVAAVVRHIYGSTGAAGDSFERRLQLSLRGQGGAEAPQRGRQQSEGDARRRQ